MPLAEAFLVVKQVLYKSMKVNSSGLNCESATSISTILLFTQKLFLMSKTQSLPKRFPQNNFLKMFQICNQISLRNPEYSIRLLDMHNVH